MRGYAEYVRAERANRSLNGRRWGTWLLTSLFATLTLVFAGLGPGALAQSSAPMTLTLAIADDQGAPSKPTIDAFIAQVATLSNGSIAIDPLYGAGNATPEGFEAGVAGLVERGEADLALNASRAWDLEGVTSLQALQAPFLITDGALAVAVATSDIATRALAGMASKGVTGLTLWPEDLRHPFALGAHAPFLTPDDFKGANILVQPSALSRSLVTTLGGTLYVDGDREADAAAGILQGAESGLLQGATLPGHPTATGDVTFYPKFQVISANAARFAGLTPAQQDILRAAAAETQRQTIAAHTSEADAATAWCANGGAVVLAGPEGVAAFEAAAKPVFDAIGKDPLTAQLITDIQALKATTTPAPGATACNAVAATQEPSLPVPSTSPSPIAGASAAAGLTLVAIGDSIPKNSPDDCPGCTGFVDRYGDALAAATGESVTVQNLSEHNGQVVDGVLWELKYDHARMDALSNADAIIVGIAHNDVPMNRDDDSCDGPYSDTIDWSKFTPECIATEVKRFTPKYQSVFAQIAALRAGKPTILRTINRYNDWIRYQGQDLSPESTATAAVIKAWNTMICAAAEASGFLCADISSAFNGPDGTTPSGDLLGSDYTHPSDKGNQVIAKVLVDLGFAPLVSGVPLQGDASPTTP